MAPRRGIGAALLALVLAGAGAMHALSGSSALPAAHVAMFSRFEGMLMMDASELIRRSATGLIVPIPSIESGSAQAGAAT